MSYATVQTGVATLIKAISGFSSQNVAENSYNMFTRGLSKGVVLRKGPSNSRRLSITANSSYPVQSEHVVNLEVYVPYKTSSKATRTALETAVQDVLDQLRKYPDLDVSTVKISGPGDVAEHEELRFAASGGGHFWRAVITYPVTEVEAVTVA